MTTDLEKQFYTTFGIKPRYYYKCKIQDTLVPEDEFILSYCSQSEVIGFCTDKKYYNSCRVLKTYKEYPPITDRILLELICLFTKEMNCFTNYWHTVEDLKKDVLEEFILDKDCFNKHQVQELFKEER